MSRHQHAANAASSSPTVEDLRHVFSRDEISDNHFDDNSSSTNSRPPRDAGFGLPPSGRELLQRNMMYPTQQRRYTRDRDFPVAEISRMRYKTNKLRQSRRSGNEYDDDDEISRTMQGSANAFRDNSILEHDDDDVDAMLQEALPPMFPAIAVQEDERQQQMSSSVRDRRSQHQPQPWKQQQQPASDPVMLGQGSRDGGSASSSLRSRAVQQAAEEMLVEGLFYRKGKLRRPPAAENNPNHAGDTSTARMSHPDYSTSRSTHQTTSGSSSSHHKSSRVEEDYHSAMQSEDIGLNPIEDDDDDSRSTHFPHLALHDLCGEATDVDDISWRNAVHLLSTQPELAGAVDHDHGWNALHICCLGTRPPPTFIVRALLYVHPAGVRQRDGGGRLPLHFLVAASAHVAIMQLLVDEYPASLCVRDAQGWTPIQLLLRNLHVSVTPAHVAVLLGMSAGQQQHGHGMVAGSSSSVRPTRTSTTKTTTTTTRRVVVQQRKGQHLNLKLDELDQLVSMSTPTVLNRDVFHETQFDTYPPDVRNALHRLTLWKRRSGGQLPLPVGHDGGTAPAGNCVGGGGDGVDHHDDGDDDDDELSNPAAIATPETNELPIHVLIRRAMVLRTELEKTNSFRSEAPTSPARPDKEVDSDDQQHEHDETFDVTTEPDEEEDSNNDVTAVFKKKNRTTMTAEHEPTFQPSVPYVAEALRVCVGAYPACLVACDDDALTPLAVALSAPAGHLVSLDIVETLLGKRNAGYQPIPAWVQDLPLHRMRPDASFFNPAMIANPSTGQLPLHVAAEEYLDNMPLVKSIHASYPAAIEVQDERGRTPLHLALDNFRKLRADPEIVALLLSDSVAQMRDAKDKLPFNLLVQHAESIPLKEPASWSVSDSQLAYGAPDMSQVYQRFFQASVLGEARPRNLVETREFLEDLQMLPAWLRRQACATSFVQDLLLEQLASPQKCFVILLDGLLLMIVLTVFRIQMKSYVDAAWTDGELSEWYTYVVYGAAGWRFLIGAITAALCINIGQFQHLCLLNGWFWIDVGAMLAAVSTSRLLYSGVDEQTTLNAGTVTTGLLWLAMLGFLSNWVYSVSIFTGALTRLSRFLVWPLFIMFCIVVAFAQMFYTLVQIDCASAVAGTVVCDVKDSYRVVYMLLRGEALVDPTGKEPMLPSATLLLALFLIVLVAFIVGVLAAILLAVLQLDTEEIALGAFWEPKLAFVLSANDFWCTERRDPNVRRRRLYAKLESIWRLLILSLQGSRLKHDPKKQGSRARSRLSTVPLLPVAVIVVPLWTIVGAMTFGLLWPPQLRRLLFRPMARFRYRHSASMAAEQASLQLASVRNEIVNLKTMYYDTTGSVENELRLLKQLLLAAMNEG